MDDVTLPGMPADPEQPAQLDPDPQPGTRKRGRPRKDAAKVAPAPARRTPAARSPRTATKAATVAEIRDEIELYLMMLAGAGSLRCAPCGAVGEQQVPKIADKLAAMIARSPAMMAKFSTGTLLADAFGLIMAALPVVQAVYMHHGPGSAHQHEHEGVSEVDPYSRYGAYTPAGAVG